MTEVADLALTNPSHSSTAGVAAGQRGFETFPPRLGTGEVRPITDARISLDVLHHRF